MRDADDQRFRELFSEHFRPIYAYALRRAPTPDLAADVAAETVVVAWRRMGDVTPGREGRLWLYGVARRVLSNTRRGERRRDLLLEKLKTLAVESLVSPADSTGVEVRQALDALPAKDREVLVLTAWEQLTPTEIAVMLGIPAATVRTRLHRARTRLRELLVNVDVEVGR